MPIWIGVVFALFGAWGLFLYLRRIGRAKEALGRDFTGFERVTVNAQWIGAVVAIATGIVFILVGAFT